MSKCVLYQVYLDPIYVDPEEILLFYLCYCKWLGCLHFASVAPILEKMCCHFNDNISNVNIMYIFQMLIKKLGNNPIGL